MGKPQSKNLFRLLPQVEALLQEPALAELAHRWNRQLVTDAVAAELDELRAAIKSSGVSSPEQVEEIISLLPQRARQRVEAVTAPSFVRVVNATGIIVHTNLGRSPLPQSALDRIAQLGGRYLDLEFDLQSGKRGRRDDGCRRLLRALFPGCDAVVVNNNAAAVLLAMNTIAAGREVVISRGQIIEIGESFRISEIQTKSGARLKEVGTTNRTRIEDFAAAIGEQTALLLSVHPSNYRVVGFARQVELEELVELGGRHGLPVIEDWGSGCFVQPEEFGIAGEESAAGRLRRGPAAICFSGDKLMGGPQAGIIVGRPETIRKMRDNHLYRALRMDKLKLIALEETLRIYLSAGERSEKIPILRLLGTAVEELQARAERLATELRAEGINGVEAVQSQAMVGGGAAPATDLPSYALALKCIPQSPEEMKSALRSNEPPIIARVKDDVVLLDLRSVFSDEDEKLAAAVRNILGSQKPPDEKA